MNIFHPDRGKNTELLQKKFHLSPGLCRSCRDTIQVSDTIISTRTCAILACGIIVLLAACMNYRETADQSFGTDLMFFSAILIFIVAAILFGQENQQSS